MASAAEHYRAVRTQLTELSDTLTDADLAAAVPALPGWTVQDTYAHLAGVCADILDGVLRDPHDQAWTAGHLSARAELGIAAIVEEWNRRAPELERLLDDPAGRAAVLAVFDVFHHGHDIRGALRLAGHRDGPEAAFVAEVMVKLRRRGWAAEGLPAVALSTPSGTWQLGEGEPAAALATSDFELARILIGRRSRAQMLTAGWAGEHADPERFVDRLATFGPPARDLHE